MCVFVCINEPMPVCTSNRNVKSFKEFEIYNANIVANDLISVS